MEFRNAPGISKFRVAECCLFHLPIPTSNWHLPLKSFVQNLWPTAPAFPRCFRESENHQLAPERKGRNKVADPASPSLWLRSSL